MTATRALGSKRWTAELAVLLFALQGLLLAFGIGAEAAPVALDRFGNVLCHSEAHDPSPADHGGPHGAGRLDCCKLGCPAGADRSAGMPPEGVPLFVAPAVAERLAYPFVRIDGVGFDWPGAWARAPPPSA
ncbi:DUF2946 family protein [Aureimonas psammosilenae]|uniref:DUF2946 family protein n=1 Tax=Aureimonas psammosilenae TaxID=2495496 RepID=UPI001261396D|nr:DUF2946 family protein [Aureimonas psammosilenae]